MEALHQAMHFRAAHGVEEILQHRPHPDFAARLRGVIPHAVHGTDRWGHPLYIERVGKISLKQLQALWADGAGDDFVPPVVRPDPELIPRAPQGTPKVVEQPLNACIWYHFQMIEYSRIGYEAESRDRGRHVSKMSAILDMEGLQLGMFANKACVERLASLSKLGDLLTIENLAAIWVVNAPWFFARCWQAVSHLLVPRTAEKLKVLSPQQTLSFLRTVVDPQHIPDFLGGECRCPGGCVSSHGHATQDQVARDEAIERWENDRLSLEGARVGGVVAKASSAGVHLQRPVRKPAKTILAPQWLSRSAFCRCISFALPPAPQRRGQDEHPGTSRHRESELIVTQGGTYRSSPVPVGAGPNGLPPERTRGSGDAAQSGIHTPASGDKDAGPALTPLAESSASHTAKRSVFSEDGNMTV